MPADPCPTCAGVGLQANTTVEGAADPRKYEVGRPLRFTGYAADEAFSVKPGVGFQPGDVVAPVARNGCGMGIDVVRASDGRLDMVWPEEVDFVTPTPTEAP